jgi:hypothetical protein
MAELAKPASLGSLDVLAARDTNPVARRHTV